MSNFSITGFLFKTVGKKALDFAIPILFGIAVFFIAKMLVVKALGWSKEDILQGQLDNKTAVIEVIKAVNEDTAAAAKSTAEGMQVQQQQAVETIERLDHVQAGQVLRQVGVEVAHAKAQQAADFRAEEIHKADPTKPAPSTAEFSSPLSPEDLAFIRASNAAVMEAYQSAVDYSK